ncbi:MAG: formylglycine-generating enzyme family protein [Saprospirales bacterium]|nr:formylglycine-generating enzyme family protein [Saprospirales bacterium]
MTCIKGCGEMLEGQLLWVCGWCGHAEPRATASPAPFPDLAPIPEGEFWMGSGEDDRWALQHEKPLRKVFLSGYTIGRTPVTNGQFADFVRATGHVAPGHWERTPPVGQNAMHPVCFVTWQDAIAYCKWLSSRTGMEYQLPTEAQWEKAARGGLEANPHPRRLFPHGNAGFNPAFGNFGGLEGRTTPVGHFPKGRSPYGCLDMAGNVSEWCLDTYFPDAFDHLPLRNPCALGPGKKVLKGGSWRSEAAHLRCSNRYFFDPSLASYGIGFRVVSTIEP